MGQAAKGEGVTMPNRYTRNGQKPGHYIGRIAWEKAAEAFSAAEHARVNLSPDDSVGRAIIEDAIAHLCKVVTVLSWFDEAQARRERSTH